MNYLKYEVFKRIAKQQCNKAPGVDGLVMNIVIKTATNIRLPLFIKSYLEVH